ncbi:hypothetical protein [Bradyrhizobium japonicum]|uniref:hypothetical protein n=1 Tax=Bradyrhizobium japonicum TaxID=375 RepID=UPI0004627468|nr:hypothetical protein [Bradyrhizobium japonicum]
MIAPSNAAPRRYFVDAAGQRVLIGLTIEETREFEGLDRAHADLSACFVEEAAVASFGLVGQRWSALYDKHESAWQNWIANGPVCAR